MRLTRSLGHMPHSTPLAAFVLLAAMLPGCARLADARINPLNWFKQDGVDARVEAAQAEIAAAPADPRGLIGTIVSAHIEPIPSGALVRAVGRGAVIGFWSADLVEDGGQEGEMVLEFRAFAPPPETAQDGPARAREVTVALAISAAKLAGLRKITVKGAQNAVALRP